MSPEALAKMHERLSEFGCPGFDASTCLSLVEALEEMRGALAALVSRLDEIHADPAYKSVWTVNQIHAGPYSGPTYVEALARARAALSHATHD